MLGHCHFFLFQMVFSDLRVDDLQILRVDNLRVDNLQVDNTGVIMVDTAGQRTIVSSKMSFLITHTSLLTHPNQTL
jgi:hypothetical protein